VLHPKALYLRDSGLVLSARFVGSVPDGVGFFLSRSLYVIILHFAKNNCAEVLYFPEVFYTTRHCMALLQDVLMSTHLRSLFVRHVAITNCIRFVKYDVYVLPIDITSIPNLIQIFPAVLELNHVVGRTDRHMTSPIYVHSMQRSHNNVHEVIL
jgi:hypothetical protein